MYDIPTYLPFSNFSPNLCILFWRVFLRCLCFLCTCLVFLLTELSQKKQYFFLVSFLYRHQKAPSVSASASLLVTSSLSSSSFRWEKSFSPQALGRPPCLCDFNFTLQISSTTFHCQKSFCPSFLPCCSFLHLFLPEEINRNPIPVLYIFHCIIFSQTDQVFISKPHNWCWIQTFI